MSDKAIYIFGYSGHAYVILDSLLSGDWTVNGYFDKIENKNNPYLISYLGFEGNTELVSQINYNYVFPTVGSNLIRRNLVNIFNQFELKQMTIIDKSSNLSPKVSIGLSTYIGKSVNINSCVKIGNGVIINTSALIEHECKIGNFSHVGPNATVCGNVNIGEDVFIGAGTVIKQNVCIESGSIVGAGAVVINDIPSNEVWVGNPARFLRHA